MKKILFLCATLSCLSIFPMLKRNDLRDHEDFETSVRSELVYDCQMHMLNLTRLNVIAVSNAQGASTQSKKASNETLQGSIAATIIEFQSQLAKIREVIHTSGHYQRNNLVLFLPEIDMFKDTMFKLRAELDTLSSKEESTPPLTTETLKQLSGELPKR